MALNQTLIQTITPDEFRGRVMGLYLMNRGTAPLGSFVFGTIAEVWGVKLAMEIAGFSGLALVLSFWSCFRLVEFSRVRSG
jgi:hypothetical protein